MKRFLISLTLCTLLLAALSTFLFPTAGAADNPVIALLNLPAPPPPNPEVTIPADEKYDNSLYTKSRPPADDAPIDLLMEYWREQSEGNNSFQYKVYPSEKALSRLFDEIEKRPEELNDYLGVLPRDERTAEFVKRIYDGLGGGTEERREARSRVRNWLKHNTKYFSSELARDAARIADFEDYVNGDDELLALARVDWDRALPIVNRLYADSSQRASQTVARWALYLHALETGSSSDTERYRDELKRIVEDRSLGAGVRDLALDALSIEKDWDGRDEWYLSLMEDESLLELGRFTGLTTLISHSPQGKYVDRMIALLESDNINVRSAAARNLLHRYTVPEPKVVKALLPWLADPKWLKEIDDSSRRRLVQLFASQKIPESVPALIAVLDEKDMRQIPMYVNSNAAMNVSNFNSARWGSAAANAMNAAANAANAAANAMNAAANAANAAAYSSEVNYPLRELAIEALGFQEDSRAVPVLKRILGETEGWGRHSLIKAIYSCGGYSISEQVSALEAVARNSTELLADQTDSDVTAMNMNSNAVGAPVEHTIPYGPDEILATHIMSLEAISDGLAVGLVQRINDLDDKEPKIAEMLRGISHRWNNPIFNLLLLGDLRKGKADVISIVRLLAERKTIREKQASDVSEIRTGSPTAYGISACILEDPNDYAAILDGVNLEAKTAMLACARLVRASLPVPKVAEILRSPDKLLALAAERYLESEDSPKAREAVLATRPGEALILGATTAFTVKGTETGLGFFQALKTVFASVSEYHARSDDGPVFQSSKQFAEVESQIQAELRDDAKLLGIYNWRENYVRVYKDRAVFSWHDDPARFRERALTPEEFENFKTLLSNNRADELPPFLSCLTEMCHEGQLLMVGKNGGRRVFVKSPIAELPRFFAELESMLQEFRRPPSAIKYWASKEVPGLEILFADDERDAKAIWKSGPDMRLLLADKKRESEVNQEIQAYIDSVDLSEADEATTEDTLLQKEKEKRAYDHMTWYSFAGGLGPSIEQPFDAAFVPFKDSFAVASSNEQWKARGARVEVRSNGEALFKIVAGKIVQVRKGNYSNPVVTGNGRWVVATKFADGEGYGVVRINLLTHREYRLSQDDEIVIERAISFIPSINRVLVGPTDDTEYPDHHGPAVEEEVDDGGMYWLLDAETGGLIKARGTVTPLVDQTYRSLQPASANFEYWAAVSSSKETVIGIYNTRNFSLKPVLKLPKLAFDSMDLWVDAAGAKAYFVYQGHLLAAPIKIPGSP